MWDSNHDIALQQVKDLLRQETGPVLTYFDHTKDVKLQVDVSKCGLGAVLLQGEKTVVYTSIALTETEENYAQIEKDITITHKPGKQISDADTLSRKPTECSESSLSEGMDRQIHTVNSEMHL